MPEGSRRKFLGAAAAAMALSWPAGVGEASTSADPPVADSADGEGYNQEDFPAGDPVQTVGGVDFAWPSPKNRTTDLTVKSSPEGVGLHASSGPATLEVMLLPEDVDDLVAELLAAKARLVEEEVEDSREWIEEKYKPDR